MVRMKIDRSGHLWAHTCKGCGARYTWKTPKAPIPACPKCKKRPEFGSRAEANLGVRFTGKTDAESTEEALEVFEEIKALYEQMPEAGQEFADDVLGRSQDIASNIEKHNRATESQLDALRNMRDGLSRWIS